MSNMVPVDTKRCQGKKATQVLDPHGHPILYRCEETPRYVAIQAKPGGDGEQGAVSCCEECLKRLHEEHPGFAFEVDLNEWQEGQLKEK